MAALARKRPSPLLTRREPSWCAGIGHAIGSATIDAFFGVSTSTSANHAKQVRDRLNITPFNAR